MSLQHNTVAISLQPCTTLICNRLLWSFIGLHLSNTYWLQLIFRYVFLLLIIQYTQNSLPVLKVLGSKYYPRQHLGTVLHSITVPLWENECWSSLSIRFSFSWSTLQIASCNRIIWLEWCCNFKSTFVQ